MKWPSTHNPVRRLIGQVATEQDVNRPRPEPKWMHLSGRMRVGEKGRGGERRGNEDREGGEKKERSGKSNWSTMEGAWTSPRLEQGNDAMFVKQLLRLSARIPD